MIRKVLGAILMAMGLAGAGWMMVEELRYLEPVELDRKPYPLRRVDLDPIEARNGVEYFGKVKLRIYIRKGGSVDHVDVVNSMLPPEATGKAVKAFADTQWEPGMKGGRSRRSVNVVEVDFEPPTPGIKRPLSSPAS